jgi:aspartyl/asparaginyl beta-hydroxylase (cupin superfamily)
MRHPQTTNHDDANRRSRTLLSNSGGGFGSSSSSSSSSKLPKQKSSRKKNNLISALNDTNDDNTKKKSKKNTTDEKASFSRTFVKSDQDQLLNDLAAKSATTIIGQAVSKSPDYGTPNMDPFWALVPSLIATKFPTATDDELQRVAGMIEYSITGSQHLLDEDVINNPWRPNNELHAYMPGLGPTEPFLDPNQLELCKLLSTYYDVITKEYEALLANRYDRKGNDRFQSVTSMNYDSGWKTMVLFYNGHRIKDFPHHLCPVTTRILESVPLAGRIAGFNRQSPASGIPVHSDGNNMWLTCQMGIFIPPPIAVSSKDSSSNNNNNDNDNDALSSIPSAHIRVGPITKYWEAGQCLLYDTTYEHETYNAHPTEERVVLHVDLFNTFKMTSLEIDVLQYIYDMREQFMKAEGVAKVGAQIL